MLGLGLAIPLVAARRRGNPLWFFDFTGAVMPAGAALTRASAAFRNDATGALASSAVDAARFDYDATLAYRGLLVEAAATNLALQSETFDNATWAKAGGSITANVAAAPAGTVTADKLIETAGVGQHRAQQVIATTPGQPYTASVYVKSVERSGVWLRMAGTATYAAATFDLAAGAIAGVTGSASLASLVGGWWRASITGIADAASTTDSISVTDAAGSFSYAGTIGSGVLIWGAQMESGASATSYIATAAATLPRAADALTLNWGGKGVPDGTPTMRFFFDDGSSQDVVSAIVAGISTAPVPLSRSRLRKVAIV